jgi:ribosomal protein S18 acetylase RimI-like enzyme
MTREGAMPSRSRMTAMTPRPTISPYNDAAHRSQVIALWQALFGYDTAHNDPALTIDKKLAVNDGLFFVATVDQTVIGTAMAGYDGHRGWLYALAVRQDRQRRGVGAALVRHAEDALRARGCVKINLQLVASNEATAAFYKALGYAIEPDISMGKVLKDNIPPVGRR